MQICEHSTNAEFLEEAVHAATQSSHKPHLQEDVLSHKLIVSGVKSCTVPKQSMCQFIVLHVSLRCFLNYPKTDRFGVKKEKV